MRWGALEKAPHRLREGMFHGSEYVCPCCNGDKKYHGTHPYWTECVRCGGIGTIVLAHYETTEEVN